MPPKKEKPTPKPPKRPSTLPKLPPRKTKKDLA